MNHGLDKQALCDSKNEGQTSGTPGSQPPAGNRRWRLWRQSYPEPESLDGIPSETLGTRCGVPQLKHGRVLARWIKAGMWFGFGLVLALVLAWRSPFVHAHVSPPPSSVLPLTQATVPQEGENISKTRIYPPKSPLKRGTLNPGSNQPFTCTSDSPLTLGELGGSLQNFGFKQAICISNLRKEELARPSSASVFSPEITANALQDALKAGIQSFQAERFTDAIAHWHQAFAPDRPSNDPLNQALVLNNLSLAHQHLGQWSAAETTLTQSLEILHQQLQLLDDFDQASGSSSEHQKSWNYYGKALNTQGWFYWRQGHPDQALVSWQQAASAYQTAQFIPGILGSQINQARALQSLGLSVSAKETLEQVQQQMADQPDSVDKAIALQSLGNALRRVGALADSRETLRQSLAIAQTHDTTITHSTLQQVSGLQSSIHLDLGNTERSLWEKSVALNLKQDVGSHQRAAVSHYQQAVSLAPSVLPRAQAMTNLLGLKVAIRGAIANAPSTSRGPRSDNSTPVTTWDELQVLWQPLANLFDELPLGRAGLEVQLNSVHSLLTAQTQLIQEPALPETLQAELEEVLTRSLQRARHLEDGRTASLAVGQLGRLYEQTNQWDKAHQATLEAITLAEPIQAQDLRYRWEWQLGRILVAQGQQKAAIYSLEEAVTTLETVRQDLLFIDADAQFSFRDDVEPLYRQLIDVLLKAPDAPQKNLRRATELVDALQLAELENYLGCNIDPVQLTDKVIDPHAAIVYPIILGSRASGKADQRLEVILQMPDQSLHRSQVDIPTGNIDELINQLSRALPNRIRWRNAQQSAGQLYDLLIRPLENVLADPGNQTIKTLVFVADGSLRQVPMGVLWDREQDQYLLEQYAIATAPSLQVVAPRPLSYPLKVLMGGASEAMEHPFYDQPFAPLPNVKNELDTIKSLQKSGVLQTDILFNEAFKQSNIEQKLQQQGFSIVHLATHGEFSSDLARTFIASSDRPIFAEDLDQILRAQDLGDDPVELLVLSACQTATGDDRATLGLAGLAVRAGARSTLATLWSVDDEATAVVMEEFYRQLVNHPDYSRAEALRQAQLAFWARGEQQGRDWKRPYFWSSFVLVGNWL